MFLGNAAAQPQQAAGEQVADLAQMGRKVLIGGTRVMDEHPMPLRTATPIRIMPGCDWIRLSTWR